MMNLKKGTQVKIITGKDKGKTGEILEINKKLKKSGTLENIKKNKNLSHLSLIKQSRLSVMPIDSKSWKILNKMGSI